MRRKWKQVVKNSTQTWQTQMSPWQSRNPTNGSNFPGGVGSFWEIPPGALLLLISEDWLENGARVLLSLLVCWRDAICDLTLQLRIKSLTQSWRWCFLWTEHIWIAFWTSFLSTQALGNGTNITESVTLAMLLFQSFREEGNLHC